MVWWRRRVGLSLVMLLGGCGPGGTALQGGTDGDDTTGASSSGVSDSGVATDSDGTASAGTTGPASCGDGVLDDDEECDLGANNADNAGCTSQCKLGVCGDGLLFIGNEDCDDGRETEACNADCTVAACGDGKVNAAAGETCDGPLAHGDCTGCAVSCDPGFEDCNGNPADGCEADLDSTQTCGACGVACGPSESCTEVGCCAAACTADTDCAAGSLCEAGCCEPVPTIPTCPSAPALEPLSLPPGIATGLNGFAIGEYTGDAVDDVVLGHDTGAQLLHGGLSLTPTDLVVPNGYDVLSVVPVDFDTDGKLDVLATTSEGDGQFLLYGDGAGTLAYQDLCDTCGSSNVLGVLDWNGDDDDDLLVTYQLPVAILVGDGQGGVADQLELASNYAGVATGRLNGDGFDDVAIHDPPETRIFHGGNPGNTEPDETAFDVHGAQVNGLTTAHLSGGAGAELLAWSSFWDDPWILVQVHRETAPGPTRWAVLLTPPASQGIPLDTSMLPQSGDVDGDGNPDLIVGTAAGPAVLFGSGDPNAPFECVHTYATGHPGVLLGVGNIDGAAGDELLASDRKTLTILASP